MDAKQIRATRMVWAYPFVLFVVALGLNFWAMDPKPLMLSLPEAASLKVLIVTALLLCLNHSWLMTATELVRVQYRMYATPEEWLASGRTPDQVPENGFRELERAHNAHRNTTENTTYFLIVLIPFLLTGPSLRSVTVWLLLYALARLGYTYSYLRAHDNWRGFFMSAGLVAMYGVASYSLLVTILS